MHWLLAQADALRLPLPDRCVHCVVTSPPYFGLRDYGVDGQIGLEPTPAEYVAKMVRVFREARRVLRDDGTLWLNIGDSYASSPPGNKTLGVSGSSTLNGIGSESYRKRLQAGHATKQDTSKIPGVKPKDLIGIPWRLAFALQDDGWYLRAENIWFKRNPMTESVKDRTTRAHEHVFLLTKRPRYFFDWFASREAAEMEPQRRHVTPQRKLAPERGNLDSGIRFPKLRDELAVDSPDGRRNMRSVWPHSSSPYKGAHFATMPPALARRCLVAGVSERGCCPRCGSPWTRVVDRERVPTRPGVKSKVYGEPPVGRVSQHDGSPYHQHAGSVGNRDPLRHVTRYVMKGWRAGCKCDAGEPVPCTVLDMFSGAATTGVAAATIPARYVGFDLNAAYLAMSAERLASPPTPPKARRPRRSRPAMPEQRRLFS